jgi:hypothetical protein
MGTVTVATLTALLMGCKSEGTDVPSADPVAISVQQAAPIKTLIDSLLIEALNEGDTVAYSRFRRKVIDQHRDHEFFYQTLIMANRHECAAAYYDLYITLATQVSVNGAEYIGMDTSSRTLALYFLARAAELGHPQAQHQAQRVWNGTPTVSVSITPPAQVDVRDPLKDP